MHSPLPNMAKLEGSGTGGEGGPDLLPFGMAAAIPPAAPRAPIQPMLKPLAIDITGGMDIAGAATVASTGAISTGSIDTAAVAGTAVGMAVEMVSIGFAKTFVSTGLALTFTSFFGSFEPSGLPQDQESNGCPSFVAKTIAPLGSNLVWTEILPALSIYQLCVLSGFFKAISCKLLAKYESNAAGDAPKCLVYLVLTSGFLEI